MFDITKEKCYLCSRSNLLPMYPAVQAGALAIWRCVVLMRNEKRNLFDKADAFQYAMAGIVWMLIGLWVLVFDVILRI
jgi:hypothetical protein